MPHLRFYIYSILCNHSIFILFCQLFARFLSKKTEKKKNNKKTKKVAFLRIFFKKRLAIFEKVCYNSGAKTHKRGVKWLKIPKIGAKGERKMATTSLIGNYQHTIDAKGRLFIPSKQREALGDTVYMTRGLDDCVFLFSKAGWEEFAEAFGINYDLVQGRFRRGWTAEQMYDNRNPLKPGKFLLLPWERRKKRRLRK